MSNSSQEPSIWPIANCSAPNYGLCFAEVFVGNRGLIVHGFLAHKKTGNRRHVGSKFPVHLGLAPPVGLEPTT